MAFAPDWLALREPADRAARDATLVRRAIEAAGPAPVIVDLGCGTGASWRVLAPLLPADARWRFVDDDAELLALAGAAAGDRAELVEADLADLDALPLDDATLVTASALLDLVSESWIAGLARRVRTPFYSALSYCAPMRWQPEDPDDATVTAAFDRHQRSDKGLGPALGPDAAARSAEIFEDAGFRVETAPSPWRLGPGMADLQRELVDGIAAAATEAGATVAPDWGRRRREAAGRSHCIVGHLDMLARPRASTHEALHADR